MLTESTYLAKKNSNTETQRYAVAIYNQTSNDSGAINENSPGGSFFGLAYKILIPVKIQTLYKRTYANIHVLPSVIKGIVKSTAVRRSYVIVKSQIAKSAFCNPYLKKKGRFHNNYSLLTLSSNCFTKPSHFFVTLSNDPYLLSGTI